MKKLISLLIIFNVLLLFSIVSFCETESAIVLSDGTIVNSTLSNENLYDSGCSINFYVSDNELVASAYTNTFDESDSVYVKVFIEKYDNNRWVSVASDINIEYNSTYSTSYLSITPSSSGKYRAYAIHKATLNGSTETDISYTNSINVY